jgi:hypothetical protein
MPLAEKKPPDRGHINVDDARELRCFARHLGITPAALREIVAKVGNSAAAVRKEVALAAQPALDGKGK